MNKKSGSKPANNEDFKADTSQGKKALLVRLRAHLEVKTLIPSVLLKIEQLIHKVEQSDFSKYEEFIDCFKSFSELRNHVQILTNGTGAFSKRIEQHRQLSELFVNKLWGEFIDKHLLNIA